MASFEKRSSLKQKVTPEARIGNKSAYYAISFWSLDFFGLGKVDSFRDAVLPDFSLFHAGSDDYLNAFFTDPRHGRYCGRYVPGA